MSVFITYGSVVMYCILYSSCYSWVRTACGIFVLLWLFVVYWKFKKCILITKIIIYHDNSKKIFTMVMDITMLMYLVLATISRGRILSLILASLLWYLMVQTNPSLFQSDKADSRPEYLMSWHNTHNAGLITIKEINKYTMWIITYGQYY